MYRQNFTKDFSTLGSRIDAYISRYAGNLLLDRAIQVSQESNRYFTAYMQREALRAISCGYLKEELLSAWLSPYTGEITEREQWVGVIMAGNIPLVGFYDFLSVLGAGYKAMVKLSSKDYSLLPALVNILTEINRYWRGRVEFVQDLPDSVSMVIAAGHDETMAAVRRRYAHIPALLRGGRSSVAVIRGDETDDNLRGLARDVFLYFGLGCRSVSALLVPEGYDFGKMSRLFSEMREVVDTDDFRSVYRYQRVQSLMDKRWFIDGGFFLLREEDRLPPPVSVIGVHFYKDIPAVDNCIDKWESLLQCVVNYPFRGSFTQFGHSQRPGIEEYPDGVDNIAFILRNHQPDFFY